VSTTPPLLELRGVTKRFGALVANDDVSMHVAPGEVVAMLGENGAGKSTLMKVVYGLLRPDAGSVRMDGTPLELGSPRDAMRAGIGMVTQEFSLVDTMTVAENCALSSLGWGRIDRGQLRPRVESAMERIGVRIDSDRIVGTLSVGERQRVEIVKALVHDCRVLILDEPTAVLTPQDIRALFGTIRRLQDSGMGVLLVSHKLKEVAEISDRVVVLRHGRLVGERRTEDVGPAELANLMMGVAEVRDADAAAAVGLAVTETVPTGPRSGERVLRIVDLIVEGSGRRLLDGVSLDVAAGEIVGVAGVSGNGQTELVEALCGRRTAAGGRVEVSGRDITALPVADRLAAGLGRLTEDRRGSVVPHLTVEQNLVLEDLASFTRRGLLDRAAVRRHAEEMIERFEIKATPTTPVMALSGGNIQKVLLARTLHRDPTALVAAQPTRGLDVGAYRYVHQRLAAVRGAGGGVLLISEDLDELRALADRIVVLLRGRIVGELAATDATNDRLGALMTGQTSDQDVA